MICGKKLEIINYQYISGLIKIDQKIRFFVVEKFAFFRGVKISLHTFQTFVKKKFLKK